VSDPQRDIPPERQIAYYLGMALTVVGGLLFISVFFAALSTVGPAGEPFVVRQPASPPFGRALVGMLLMMGGGALMNFGRAGLAGSGVILDPQQARRDLEPWSRVRGGMLEDTLSESPTVQRAAGAATPATVVKVRCRSCGALNDESDRYCGQCGQAV